MIVRVSYKIRPSARQKKILFCFKNSPGIFNYFYEMKEADLDNYFIREMK